MMHYVGKPCEDCSEGVCTMNCSGAVTTTRLEWLAASMWAGVFPEKATAEQVRAWKASNAPVPAQIASSNVMTVPVVPTDAMVAAGASVWSKEGAVYVEDIYAAMVAAAPLATEPHQHGAGNGEKHGG
ncbi:hypothetical protein [uncultured Sphingomonas sp.]|uniref:hypothetical protein n=1 Tax=uncultured Sphingomonas sp. TaxID=158754 RepID=UPI0030F71CE9